MYVWPANGGLYVLRHCTGLELDFLGLSRFEDKVRPGYDPHTGRPLFTTLNGSTPLNPEQEQEQKKRDEEEERHCDKSTIYPPSTNLQVGANLCVPYTVRMLGAS